MNLFLYQLKQAWQSLQRRPGFVLSVVSTMGITLGVLLCVLTLGYVMLLKPLPYPGQEALVKLSYQINDDKGKLNAEAFTYPGLVDIYQKQSVFSKSAMLSYDQDVLTSEQQQPTQNLLYATPEWFDLLSVPMALGRKFEASEALDTNNPVAVLSYHAWQKTFAGAADILSRSVVFNGVHFKVVGVMAPSFVEPQIYQTGLTSDIILPWDFNQNTQLKQRWTNITGTITLVGKLKAGISAKQAGLSLTPAANELWFSNNDSVPFFHGWTVNIAVNSFKNTILGDSLHTYYLLLTAIVGLLLIAFANIANLFISRTVEQQRNIAINAALGASRTQLKANLLAEAGVLMLLAGILALAIASVGFYGLQRYLADVLPRVNELGLNWVTLSCALASVVILAYLFASFSVRMLNYRLLNSAIQSSGKGTGVQVSRKTRKLLVISQMTIAMLLVFANITLFNKAVSTINQPLGFSTDNLVTVQLALTAAQQPEPQKLQNMLQEVKRQLLQLPQVAAVSFSGSPLHRFALWAVTDVSSGQGYTPERKNIDQDYFDIIKQPLLAGHNFSEQDVKDRNFVLIVNDAFAKTLSPDGNVIGRKFEVGAPEPLTIIGVVQGIKKPGASSVPIRAYVTGRTAGTSMLIKLKDQQLLTREQMTTMLAHVDGSLALFELESFADAIHNALFTQYVTAITSAVLALFTLLLAGLGLYGILSYSTQMRRFEIGTRMAIGAKGKDILGLIIKDNAGALLIGVGLSIVVLAGGYWVFGERLTGYLSLATLPLFIVTLAAISLITFAACYLPLRQYIYRPAVHALRGAE